MTREYEIVVVDTNIKRWPKAADLVNVGVPLRVAERYRKLRRHFTIGLKRDIKKRVN